MQKLQIVIQLLNTQLITNDDIVIIYNYWWTNDHE